MQTANRIFVVDVSIHAPARGATMTAWLLRLFGLCFNPRTREGCDYIGIHFIYKKYPFQSTHPRGVRPDSRHQETPAN